MPRPTKHDRKKVPPCLPPTTTQVANRDTIADLLRKVQAGNTGAMTPAQRDAVKRRYGI